MKYIARAFLLILGALLALGSIGIWRFLTTLPEPETETRRVMRCLEPLDKGKLYSDDDANLAVRASSTPSIHENTIIALAHSHGAAVVWAEISLHDESTFRHAITMVEPARPGLRALSMMFYGADEYGVDRRYRLTAEFWDSDCGFEPESVSIGRYRYYRTN